MLLRFSFSTKASRMSTYTNAAHNSRGICTYDFIGLKVPLESALGKKISRGWAAFRKPNADGVSEDK
jgi:hypothetical protein